MSTISMHTQYVLLDAEGEPVERYHQDDQGGPLVAYTIEDLVNMAAEAYHCLEFPSRKPYFLKMMDNPDSEYGGYTIVREEVSQVPLTEEDEAALQKLREE